MPLTCSCDYDYEPEPGQWEIDWYSGKERDFEVFEKWISKRCISCDCLISYGQICLEHPRKRHPYTEIEAKIHGIDWECFEEPKIKIPPVYHCEKCGEIWLNLQSVGFECLSPAENMPEMLKQYQHDYVAPKTIEALVRKLKQRPAKKYGLKQ